MSEAPINAITAIPRPLLRRQIVDSTTANMALRAVHTEKMRTEDFQYETLAQAKTLKWLRTIPLIGEEAMFQVADAAISCSYRTHGNDNKRPGRPPQRNPDMEILVALDNALVEMICKHYYENSVYPNQWCTDTLYNHISKAVSLYLDPDWLLPANTRRPRQSEFLVGTRRQLRKCHTHRLASILAYRVGEGRLPNELIEPVRLFLYHDDNIASAVTQNGTVISGETNVEELDRD